MPYPENGINVSAGPAVRLDVAGYPDPIGLNTSGSVTVTAMDGSDNVAVGYTGTVHLSASGGAASVPGNYTFKGSDSGVHSFTGVSFGAPGTWTLLATDIATSSITGNQPGITVTNQGPTCSALAKTTGEDTAFSDVIDNFCSDPNPARAHSRTGTRQTRPTAPSAGFLGTTGAFTYTPDLGYVGTDSFTTSVSDGKPRSRYLQRDDHGRERRTDLHPGSRLNGLEDAGAQQVNAWATGIGPGGGADEAGQALNFIVTNNHTRGSALNRRSMHDREPDLHTAPNANGRSRSR